MPYKNKEDKNRNERDAYQANPARPRAYRKARYHADIEKTQAKAKAKRQRQGEALRAYFRAYYARNKERRRLLQNKNKQDFSARHPGYSTDITRRRRAQKKGASLITLTRTEWEEIKVHYGHRCVYCKRKMKRLEQDHLTPLSKGGNHTKQNVVPCCRSCNAKKSAGPVLTPVQPLLL